MRSRWWQPGAISLAIHGALLGGGFWVLHRNSAGSAATAPIPVETDPGSVPQRAVQDTHAGRKTPDNPTAPAPSLDPKTRLLPGEPGALARLADAVRERTSRHLRLPPGVAVGTEPSEVLLRISIAPDGALASVEIERSSGTASLDLAAREAAIAAAPFGDLSRDIAGFPGADFRLPVRIRKRR